MAGIAGIAAAGQTDRVREMLGKLAHRGGAGSQVTETASATLGVVWPAAQSRCAATLSSQGRATDDRGGGHAAYAQATSSGVRLGRDELGVAPLYYGHDAHGSLAFASEVKSLLTVTKDVHELGAGCTYDGSEERPYFRLGVQPSLAGSEAGVAEALRCRLDDAVSRRIDGHQVGAWLSGGLDSSAMVAFASRHVRGLHTFAAGLPGAEDLQYAQEVAASVGASHHELALHVRDLIAALPEAIYHLESFDALLVRSSVVNYLIAGVASDYVSEVFSGEGGDESFAGYHYLKKLDAADLPGELVDIAGRLHNTALQRVDRSSSAHGTVAHVPFLDREVFEFALQVPVGLKLHAGVEKWILRRALDGLLPQHVLDRPKAKFWKGAGVEALLADHAEAVVTDADFRRERDLPTGDQVRSKEELMYYRILRDGLGDLRSYDWMGRSKQVAAA